MKAATTEYATSCTGAGRAAPRRPDRSPRQAPDEHVSMTMPRARNSPAAVQRERALLDPGYEAVAVTSSSTPTVRTPGLRERRRRRCSPTTRRIDSSAKTTMVAPFREGSCEYQCNSGRDRMLSLREEASAGVDAPTHGEATLCVITSSAVGARGAACSCWRPRARRRRALRWTTPPALPPLQGWHLQARLRIHRCRRTQGYDFEAYRGRIPVFTELEA